jgi:cytochrome c peroxidase
MHPKSIIFLVGMTVLLASIPAHGKDRWTGDEGRMIQSLSLAALEPAPADPSNRFTEDPSAIELGQQLFFETRLSFNGEVSCASCHLPDQEFQDGTPLARGVGTTHRRTMPVTGTAYSPFLFWDGRKDSQWAQALGPLESNVEHGGDRTQYARVIRQHYEVPYEAVFGPLPDLESLPAHAGPVADPTAAANWQALSADDQDSVTQVFVNIGKAIAAFERRIGYGPSRFDRYAESLAQGDRQGSDLLSADEKAGLRLFIGKANCVQCHNGPLLTNQEFHNTGVPAVADLPRDRGRTTGVVQVLADEFNCRSRWSDARGSCRELDYVAADGAELQRAFKVPSLRNVADRAPYMHAGQVPNLTAVVAHYNRAPEAPEGQSELKPLKLGNREISQLVSFLQTLSGGIETPTALIKHPPSIAYGGVPQ